VKRLVVVPAVLFVGFAGGAFALAQLHPAKPEAPKAAGDLPAGDAYRGESLFQKHCAACHGINAEGGVGPALAGSAISLAEAKATIETGRGVMPAGLVTGGQQADVLAYLATILQPG
jgi:cytochrome c551